MGMEVRPFGIESVTLVPGAFTTGTEHFAHAQEPAYTAVVEQYGDLSSRMATLGEKLKAIDAAHGGALTVEDVGRAACQVLSMPRGARPSRVIIDGQQKGTEAIDDIYHEKQTAFLVHLGLADLAPPAPAAPQASPPATPRSAEENP